MDIKGIVHIGAHYGEEIQEYVDNGILKLGQSYQVLLKEVDNNGQEKGSKDN
jgi:hypothetical protein